MLSTDISAKDKCWVASKSESHLITASPVLRNSKKHKHMQAHNNELSQLTSASHPVHIFLRIAGVIENLTFWGGAYKTMDDWF